ncbi:MAG: DUF4159 domain-containing protein [Phycisphaerae bacterium]|nr:DUF4159 domain-containing protein [Phycisphaerae bacterium]
MNMRTELAMSKLWMGGASLLMVVLLSVNGTSKKSAESADSIESAITCANLTYGGGKTSRCFAPAFLKDFSKSTDIPTATSFASILLMDSRVFEHPFCVMSGEGAFQLTDEERTQLRDYLTRGGFLLASAGCSSAEWSVCFRKEMTKLFADLELTAVASDHAVFKTVHDVTRLQTKRRNHQPTLEGLTLDGRLIVLFSSDGLNDTADAGGSCCCCGGDEIVNARQVNVNILAYALTH